MMSMFAILLLFLFLLLHGNKQVNSQFSFEKFKKDWTQKVSDAAKDVTKTASDVAMQAADAGKQVANKAGEAVNDVTQRASDAAKDVTKTASNIAMQAAEAGKQVADKAGEAVNDVNDALRSLSSIKPKIPVFKTENGKATAKVGFTSCSGSACVDHTLILELSHMFSGVDSYIQLVIKYGDKALLSKKLSLSVISGGHMKTASTKFSGELVAADARKSVCLPIPIPLLNPRACIKFSNIVLGSTEGLSLDWGASIDILLYEIDLINTTHVSVPVPVPVLGQMAGSGSPGSEVQAIRSCIQQVDKGVCLGLPHCGWCTHNGGRCLPVADREHEISDALGICTHCGWFPQETISKPLKDVCLDKVGCGMCHKDCVEGNKQDMIGWKACGKGWTFGPSKDKVKEEL